MIITPNILGNITRKPPFLQCLMITFDTYDHKSKLKRLARRLAGSCEDNFPHPSPHQHGLSPFCIPCGCHCQPESLPSPAPRHLPARTWYELIKIPFWQGNNKQGGFLPQYPIVNLQKTIENSHWQLILPDGTNYGDISRNCRYINLENSNMNSVDYSHKCVYWRLLTVDSFWYIHL